MRDRVFAYVSDQYGSEPEYLWAKTPDTAVLRHMGNKKWYAIFMNIPRRYLGLAGDEHIDVMNVKCTPAVREILLAEGGAYPAYHMNKQHWISLPLDGSLGFETIVRLVDESYELTK